MTLPRDVPRIALPYAYTVALILFAAALRVWPLALLGTTIPWVTFYPAVMVAGLLGGLGTGLFGTLVTCVVVIHAWPLIVPAPFIRNPADWLGLAVFCANCALISAITEGRRRANRRAREAREVAERANRAKSVFLANMSHELRTPLIGVLGFSRLLAKSTNITDTQRSRLHIITRSGEHLLGLINDILDLSKIESGRLLLEESATNLAELLDEIHASLQIAALNKGLTLNFDLQPTMPTGVITDPTRLRQILINLLGNAIKFTSLGGVTLRVTVLDESSSTPPRVRFEVIDTGPGIPEHERERVFEPFVQIGQQASTDPGTGLGLSICRQYAKLLGGDISVHANPSGGTIFRVSLPMRPAPHNNGESAPARTSQSIVGLQPGQPRRRLLIADDAPDSRLLLRTLLEPFGFDLREVADGQAVVDTCASWQPDLVWLDIRMPVMNGLDATKIIRARTDKPQPKLVALTAHALEDERLAILAAGCDDVIRKPYQEREIFAALERHLSVGFQYADDDAKPLNGHSLDVLPSLFDGVNAAWMRDFTRAVERLDAAGCLALLSESTDLSPAATSLLRSLVTDLRFNTILSALDERAMENKR